MSEEEIKKELAREIMAKQQWYEEYQKVKEKNNKMISENIYLKEELRKTNRYSLQIEELRNQNAELRDELEVKNAELYKEKEARKLILFAVENDYISKSKIKAKIKEKQSRIDKLHPASDCVIIDDLENQIQALQELLEKEE